MPTGIPSGSHCKRPTRPWKKFSTTFLVKAATALSTSLTSCEPPRPVTLQLNDVPLVEALEACLQNQPFTYAIVEKTVVIKEKIYVQPRILTPPPITVKGRVVNENGEPVEWVTVKIKGTNLGTSTNVNGEFTLYDVDANAVLEFTSTSIEKSELKINGRNNLRVGIKTRMSALDEVQVIPYGTTTARLNTGNSYTVRAKDIEKQPVTNPLLALQGRVPGLVINQATGLPGSGVFVQIQGRNNIDLRIGSDPLYVIDGIPYPSRFLFSLNTIQGTSGNGPDIAGYNTGSGTPLNNINPADIESIDILKDADATAIYGSRAANGAILITTKKGKAGKTKLNLNIQNGWGRVGQVLGLLNKEQYLEMRHEALKNENKNIGPTDYDLNGTWDTLNSTDWQKELIGGTAQYKDAQFSLSGGNTNTQFLIGVGYHRETTVFPGNLSLHRGSGYFNINNTSANHKFKIQLSGSYMVSQSKLIDKDLTFDAMGQPPVAPRLYKTDGSLNWAPDVNGNSTWINPVSYLSNKFTGKSNNLFVNALFNYEVIPGLYVRNNLGYTYVQTDEKAIYPTTGIVPDYRSFIPRHAEFNISNINTWMIEPHVDYEKKIGKLIVQTLVGTSLQQNISMVNVVYGLNQSSDILLENISAAPVQMAFNGSSKYKYCAGFGRMNLNWHNRYLFSLSTRRDGSSRFGSENQFNNFWSISGGWLFSNEEFVRKTLDFLSFGKLRMTFGTTGNDQIGDYQFLNLYRTVTTNILYQNVIGLRPNKLTNPYIAWQETNKLQFGLDLGLFNDRLIVNTTYYNNKSSNQVLPQNLPIFTGFSDIITNIPAVVKNYGWEFSMNASLVKRQNFEWSCNLNLTIPKNKLVSYPGLENSENFGQYHLGRSLSTIRAYQFLGVDPQTGIYQVADKDGKPTLNPDFLTDANIYIDLAPELFGGIQNILKYKRIELDVLFQYVKQIGPNNFFGNYPAGAFRGGPGGSIGNQPKYILDRWKKPGDEASSQMYGSFDLFPHWNNAWQSEATYSDASFVRLKNISLAWMLPTDILNKINLQNAKIYIQSQNLLTISNYKGLDPETRNSRTLPPLRVLTFGILVLL